MEQNSQLGLGIFKTFFWLVVWNIFIFPLGWEYSWIFIPIYFHIFQRGRAQPPSSDFHAKQVGIPKGNRRNVHGQHGLRAAHSVLNSEGPDRPKGQITSPKDVWHAWLGLQLLQWKSSSISTPTSIGLADHQGSNALRSEDSKDFQELQKEYEAGYGVRALRGT